MNKSLWVAVVILLFFSARLYALRLCFTNEVSCPAIHGIGGSKAIIDPRITITSFEDSAVIPANFSGLLVEWSTPANTAEAFTVRLRFAEDTVDIAARQNSIRLLPAYLKPFLKSCHFSVEILSPAGLVTSKSPSKTIKMSMEPLNDDIVFRLVEPEFNPRQTSRGFLFSSATASVQPLYSVAGSCIGCHAPGCGLEMFNVKQDTDRRLIIGLETSLAQFEARYLGEFSFVALSPDGRYAAIVKGKPYKIHTRNSNFEPFDMRYESGDIFIYDVLKKIMQPLPGASELHFVEDMPCFSSDGKQVYFSRYASDSMGISSMDLFSVAFNDGLGGEAIKIFTPPKPKTGVFFSKCSPDGRWISFCMGDCTHGAFARTSSDIYLLSIDSKKLIKLRCNKDRVMDSWHTWSSNSKWLAFSSNREANRCTALYLVGIDGAGADSPALKVIGFDSEKVNQPQFVKMSCQAPLSLNRFLENINDRH